MPATEPAKTLSATPAVEGGEPALPSERHLLPILLVNEIKSVLKEQGIFSTELQTADVEEILKNTIPDLLQRPEIKNEVDEARLKEVAVLLREERVNLKASIGVKKMFVSGDIEVAFEVENDEAGGLQLTKTEIVSEKPFYK